MGVLRKIGLILLDLVLRLLEESAPPKQEDPPDVPPVEPELPTEPIPQPSDPPVPPIMDTGLESVRHELLLVHNRHRDANGAEALMLNQELNIIAQRQANYQASIGGWNDLHSRPNGHSLSSDLSNVSFRYSSGGENAAAGYKTAVGACDGWKKSPGHNQNMLRRSYRYVGFGRTTGKNGTVYWIAVFAG